MPLAMDANIVNHARTLSNYKQKKTKLGHIVLAVLQEEQMEEKGGTQFCVYLLDSAPRYLKDIKGFMARNIRHVAKALYW